MKKPVYVVVAVRIILPRAKFHAESFEYFDCISFFSRCQANSDVPACPGSPGRLSPCCSSSAPRPSSELTSRGMRTSRGQTSASSSRTLVSLTEHSMCLRFVPDHDHLLELEQLCRPGVERCLTAALSYMGHLHFIVNQSSCGTNWVLGIGGLDFRVDDVIIIHFSGCQQRLQG